MSALTVRLILKYYSAYGISGIIFEIQELAAFQDNILILFAFFYPILIRRMFSITL